MVSTGRNSENKINSSHFITFNNVSRFKLMDKIIFYFQNLQHVGLVSEKNRENENCLALLDFCFCVTQTFLVLIPSALGAFLYFNHLSFHEFLVSESLKEFYSSVPVSFSPISSSIVKLSLLSTLFSSKVVEKP